MTCSDDPCSDDVATTAAILCPSPLTCVPTEGGLDALGVCMDVAQGFGEECDPDGPDVCQSGTYCKATDDGMGGGCQGFYGLIQGQTGNCSLPVREGGGCDAEWGSEGCAVCEAGTVCRPDPDRGGLNICQRLCDDDNDCPCGLAADTTCQEDGFCGICIGNGSACKYRIPDPAMDAACNANPGKCRSWIHNTPFACCDAQATCVPDVTPTQPEVLYDGQCCREDDSLCTPGEGQCCDGALCDPVDGKCRACGEYGDVPPTVGGSPYCCEGLEERGGVCLVVCNETVGGSCEACPGISGTWACTPTGDQCQGPPSSTPDLCNGKDDDCDRRVDEDYTPQSCMASVDDCSGTFPGQTRCTRDEGVVCEATDFCRYDFDTSTFYGNLDDCGWGMVDCSVGGNADCPPGTSCFVNPCWDGFSSGPGFIGCWPIDQPRPDNCPNGDYYVQNNTCTGSACWAEGHLGGGAACP